MRKQTEGQLSFDFSQTENAPGRKTEESYVRQAVEYAQRNRSLHLGTAMRVFRLSATDAQRLVGRLQEEGVIGPDGRVPRNVENKGKGNL